jgi:hypothetical protein
MSESLEKDKVLTEEDLNKTMPFAAPEKSLEDILEEAAKKDPSIRGMEGDPTVRASAEAEHKVLEEETREAHAQALKELEEAGRAGDEKWKAENPDRLRELEEEEEVAA